MSVFSQSPISCFLVHPHHSHFFSFGLGGIGSIRLLFLYFTLLNLNPIMNAASVISGHLRMSRNESWLSGESQRHYETRPPYTPTHTIIRFISQHLRALRAFTAICAEFNWVIFPSWFNSALLSCSITQLLWRLLFLLLTHCQRVQGHKCWRH